MTVKERIDQDLKTALLAGDRGRANFLRGLKSAILYEEVAQGVREKGLDEGSVTKLLFKEAKKRQESADLYKQGGDERRAKAELEEKDLIAAYLPAQPSEEELKELVDKALHKLDKPDPRQMGQIIAEVKQASGGGADGATIARLVKERLST